MATKKDEYNLSYSAAEIDKKLIKIDGFSVEFTNVNANLSRIKDQLDAHIHTIDEVDRLQDTLDELNNKIATGGSSSGYDVATQYTNGLMSAEDKEQLDYGGIPIVKVSSANGVSYTATVDGIKDLRVGTKITVIPETTSTSKTVTLNVNDLGAKNIRMPSTDVTSGSTDGAVVDWLSADIPVTVQYNGTYWIVADFQGVSTQGLEGAISVENGGTGATTAKEARTNLGLAIGTNVAPMYTYGKTDITAGSASTAATGTLHFIYEETTE